MYIKYLQIERTGMARSHRPTTVSTFEEYDVVKHDYAYYAVPAGNSEAEMIKASRAANEIEEEINHAEKFDTQAQAECYARLQELGKSYEHHPVEYEQLPHNVSLVEDSDPLIPLTVAQAGSAQIAACLHAAGHRESQIARWLDVSERTVTQYLSDVRRGER